MYIVISKKTDKSIEGLAWFKNKYVMILDYMKLSGNDVLKWREVLLKKKLEQNLKNDKLNFEA